MPATRDDAIEAGSHMITATEMGLLPKQCASPEEKTAFTNMLVAYGYSRAELLEAMREVPRDPERFGGRGVTIQDVERVVREGREMRAKLGQPIPESDMHQLVERYSEDLARDDFHCCGYGHGMDSHEPRYRYAPDVEEHAGPPRPDASQGPSRSEEPPVGILDAIAEGAKRKRLAQGESRREAGLRQQRRQRLLDRIATGRFDFADLPRPPLQ